MIKSPLFKERKDIAQKFCQFLEENNIFEQWKENTLKAYPPHRVEKKHRLAYCINPIYCERLQHAEMSLIDYAFRWDATPQKRAFWQFKDKEWRKFLRNYYWNK